MSGRQPRYARQHEPQSTALRCGFFPVDEKTSASTCGSRADRSELHRYELVEQYSAGAGTLWRDDAREIQYTATLELEPRIRSSLAPGRDRNVRRIASRSSDMQTEWQTRTDASAAFEPALDEMAWRQLPRDGGQRATATDTVRSVQVDCDGEELRTARHGAVVIAAITSCTNTSNPSGDGRVPGCWRVTRVERGLRRKSVGEDLASHLAPRSLPTIWPKAGLLDELERLRASTSSASAVRHASGTRGPLAARRSDEAMQR